MSFFVCLHLDHVLFCLKELWLICTGNSKDFPISVYGIWFFMTCMDFDLFWFIMKRDILYVVDDRTLYIDKIKCFIA
jgi:hypothetical protein